MSTALAARRAAAGRVRHPSPGAAGLGDPYFGDAGNGGYDVSHYDVALAYAGVRTGAVDATVTVTATATQDLSAFDLDFRGPEITAVTVDGREARHRRAGRELVVTRPGRSAPGARSGSPSGTRAGRCRSGTRRSAPTGGCRARTARSSPPSRTARRPGCR
ncbi:hypothetical protein ACFQY7_49250 [Actinomadura luteofluorescens]|uniref:hypothetical protein n=1 Tax=Actinomadura luteofluorescens TaxID=46163 RepID=UPI00362C84CB